MPGEELLGSNEWNYSFSFLTLKMYQPTFCIRNPNRINPSFSKWIFLQ